MRYPLIFAITLTIPLIAIAADNKLNTIELKASYGFGVDFAKRLKQQGIILDINALTSGIRDASEGRKLAIPDDEINQARKQFLQKLQADLIVKQKKQATKNLEEGKIFLAANAEKEGIVTTSSGLQYKIIKPGSGAIPKLDDTVVTHYKGTLIDGREFDSSVKRNKPATFPVKGVIKGWTEALQLMKVGAKWQLFIPSDIAYGSSKRSELIQANSTLIFELELLSIK